MQIENNSIIEPLTQGLQTEDNETLEWCFSHQVSQLKQEQDLIRNTLVQLSPSQIQSLISQISTRIMQYPESVSYLLLWLKSVLMIHTSVLMQSDKTQLQTLFQYFKHRTSSFEQLQKLNGQLQVLMMQKQIQGNVQNKQQQKGVLEIKEGSDVEEMEIDEKQPSKESNEDEQGQQMEEEEIEEQQGSSNENEELDEEEEDEDES